MIRNDKPAASRAAGSVGDAFSWQATHSEYETSHAAAQARLNSQYAAARAESQRLQDKVDALEDANRELNDKLGLVGSRLEALLARIPEA